MKGTFAAGPGPASLSSVISALPAARIEAAADERRRAARRILALTRRATVALGRARFPTAPEDRPAAGKGGRKREEEEGLMTPREAAGLLGTDILTVRQWRAIGVLPAAGPGFFRRADILTLMLGRPA